MDIVQMQQKHCNKILEESQFQEDVRVLKSQLMKLHSEYDSGLLDMDTFKKKEEQIMSQIISLSQNREQENSNDVL